MHQGIFFKFAALQGNTPPLTPPLKGAGNNEDGLTPIFVLTDDIRLLQAVEARFPQLRFVLLCRPDDRGYHHQAFCQTDPQQKKEAITRLLISVNILRRGLQIPSNGGL